jgi:CSLREA domain-containing protein
MAAAYYLNHNPTVLMKRNTFRSCSAALFLSASLISVHPAAQAAQTTINFDDVAGGTMINTHYAGVTFTNPIGGNVFAKSGLGFAPSSPNVVCITNGGTTFPFFDSVSGAVDARFSTPMRLVSVDVRPVGPVDSFLTPLTSRPYLQAFDAAGNLLATVYYSGPLPTNCCYDVGPVQTLSYTSTTANIARARLSSQQPNPYHTYGMFDNLSFDDGYYTLSVSILGNASVTAVPSQASYFYGTVVNLTATPATDWAFNEWWNVTDSIIGTANPLAVTMNSDKNIGYYFHSLDQSEPNFVVTTADDHDDGVAGITDCTLREAINAANAFASPNTITFATNVTGAITLTLGQLTINHDVTIIGPGAKALAITVSNSSSSFHISGGAAAAISGLSIRNVVVGFSSYTGMTIDGGSSLSLNACSVSGFRSTGIFNGGTLTLNSCTVAGNSGDTGGGISNYGLLTVTNSTISGNGASSAGGIYNHPTGTLTLNSTTVHSNYIFNSFQGGGGIRNNSGVVMVRNSIVAGNTNVGAATGPDCIGSFTSLGYNLIGKTNDSSGFSIAIQDQIGSIASPLNPLLGPLADNGGPTLTHKPLSGSPALDKGNGGGLTSDQRGRLRPYDFLTVANAAGGDGSDIGAYEVNPPVLNIVKSLSNVALSWSTNEAGFTLESAAQLVPPATWTPVPVAPTIFGSQYTVTTNTVAGKQFYRLNGP